MSCKKLTERQQIELLAKKYGIVDENVIDVIFAYAMEYKNVNPNLTLNQLFSYAHARYTVESITRELKNLKN